MADRTTHMLNDMFAAVNEGFSYDGIVSVPETGLEDADYPSGMAGSLRDSMDRVRMKGATLSQGAVRIFKQNQRDSNPTHSTSITGTREKSHGEVSFALSDQQSEVQDKRPSISGTTLGETNQRDLHIHKQAAAQPCRGPLPEDEIDAASVGCLPGLPRCPNIRMGGIHLPHRNRRKLSKEISEGWDVVTPITAPLEEELPEVKDVEVREIAQPYNTIQGEFQESNNRVSGNGSDMKQARLPRKREEKEVLIPPPITGIDRERPERQPRKNDEKNHFN